MEANIDTTHTLSQQLTDWTTELQPTELNWFCDEISWSGGRG